jgi:hypothetical protein
VRDERRMPSTLVSDILSNESTEER